MRFSVAQQKEIIEAGSGRFIGYIVDAEICEKSGMITGFLVAEPKKILHIFQAEEATRKIAIQDILTIGKDVILVKGIMS
ncbi:YlmC/YmxH family sporulation protein [Metasolibacillus sp. FSL H7-0170]|uniref:PRC-barrel domain-containing protein n=1 Tax=Metasolibacillus TaxID=2703677 RepID=UPI000797EDA6|nr:sporulation protein [Metasolibacillus fluoroglycofenilyticus]KYG89428.1 sporulation protein [[Bacillus] sp. KCTC 13219]